MSEAEILKRVKKIEDEVKKINNTVDNIETIMSNLDRKLDINLQNIAGRLEELDSTIQNME